MPPQWTNFGFLSSVTTPSGTPLEYLGSAGNAPAQLAPKGWGIGFYQGANAFVIRKATTAMTAKRVREMSDTISSRVFVAHVRQPSVGEIKDSNTQPYRFGAWLFTHQGTIERFRRIKPILLRHLQNRYQQEIIGTTDSEHCLYLFLTCFTGAGYLKRGDVPLEKCIQAVQTMGQLLSEWSDHVGADEPWGGNFIITNGRYLLATRRRAPVYYRAVSHVPQVIPLAEHTADSPDPNNAPDGAAVMIASEPLDAETWEELPENRVLCVLPDCSTHLETFVPATP